MNKLAAFLILLAPVTAACDGSSDNAEPNDTTTTTRTVLQGHAECSGEPSEDRLSDPTALDGEGSEDIAFVLSGAASLIAQEIALLAHLTSADGIMGDHAVLPSRIAGTSSGSISAVLLNKVLADSGLKVPLLEDWDRVFNEALAPLGNDTIYASALGANDGQAAYDLLLGGVLDKMFGAVGDGFKDIMAVIKDFKEDHLLDIPENIEKAVRAFEEAYEEYEENKTTIDNILKNIMSNGYIFQRGSYTKTVGDQLKEWGFDHLSDLPINTTISATLRNGIDYEKMQRWNTNDPDAGQLELLKVILASSAIPLAFPPVEIDGDFYVDGGTGTDGLPVAAFTGRKLDKLYIIAPFQPGLLAETQAENNRGPSGTNTLANLSFALSETERSLWIYQMAYATTLVKDPNNAFIYMPNFTGTGNDFDSLSFNEEAAQYDATAEWVCSGDDSWIEDIANVPIPITMFLEMVPLRINLGGVED